MALPLKWATFPTPDLQASQLVSDPNGLPAMSVRFGFVYPSLTRTRHPYPPSDARDTIVLAFEDSSLVFATDVRTRTVDTVAMVDIGTMTRSAVWPGQSPGYREPIRANTTKPPRLLTSGDAWAVTTDGSIAILHGQQYRMSWINSGGTRTESRPIAYPWKRLTDDDKQRTVDSANADQERKYEAALAQARVDSAAGRLYGPLRGFPGYYDTHPQGPISAEPPLHYEVSAIPDYTSPFVPGRRAMVADADNRVWIRIGRPPTGETAATYDIVNRQGDLIDRIRLPEGRELVGFGSGGAVYLVAHDAGKEILERAQFTASSRSIRDYWR